MSLTHKFFLIATPGRTQLAKFECNVTQPVMIKTLDVLEYLQGLPRERNPSAQQRTSASSTACSQKSSPWQMHATRSYIGQAASENERGPHVLANFHCHGVSSLKILLARALTNGQGNVSNSHQLALADNTRPNVPSPSRLRTSYLTKKQLQESLTRTLGCKPPQSEGHSSLPPEKART